ncbi:MAG: calcium/sodium antiporter [Candidatus Marinimicrobia bacterium]|nr:calcium/sodium antiporter [Candidatus Neomarinimicrobiota bacterium]
MEIFNIVQIAFSIILLWKGAELLIDNSVKVAYSLNISPLVIGLTVVAFGTSAPEFAVTINAAISGQSDISVSNVIGSNIFNLGFILGGIAIIKSIKTDRILVYRDGTVLMATTIVILFFFWDLTFTRFEGLILFLGLILYIIFLFTQKDNRGIGIKFASARTRDILFLLLGITAVVVGGYILKIGAIALAQDLGLSEWIIGVTIIAAGTSAPELVTSLIAVIKGQHGISIGNLIGSDLFNLLGVLGLAGIISPLTVSSNAIGSLAMLVGMVVLVVFFLRTGWILSRTEGTILVLINLLRWTMDFATQ